MGSRQKRIIVTPAGRRSYLQLLWNHLQEQRDSFDEWHLWLNTTCQEDIAWIRSLPAPVRVIEPANSRPQEGIRNIHRFFPGCVDPDTNYLRLDDDVVWLQDGFVEKMFSRREDDKASFLHSANVVNNAVCSHLHSKKGVVPPCNYECTCPIGWARPEYAAAVHESFLTSTSLEPWRFGDHTLPTGKRFSINAISWRGDIFKKFGGNVGTPEEQWLTMEAPKTHGPTVIIGDAICVHFAFHTQRRGLDEPTLLARYSNHVDPDRP